MSVSISGDGLVTGIDQGFNIVGVLTASSGLVVAAGTTAVPSISPSGDSNTGIFFPSADTIAFGEGGVEVGRFDSSGRLGIGTNNPSQKLHLGQGRIRLDEDWQITWLSTAGTQRTRIVGDSSSNFIIETGASNTERLRVNSNGHTLPGADNTYDLGASGTRWRNIYTADLQMSNEGSKNDIDGTWGAYTIQEGENDLFLINRRTGKKYKFLLEEVK
jgi:hypothetical protein